MSKGTAPAWITTTFHDMHTKGFANNPANNRMALTEHMYLTHLVELCVNRFEWFNLPETVDPRYLELTLFQTALTVFFQDKGEREGGFANTGEFLVLPGAGGGMPNSQDVPTHFTVAAPHMLITAQLIPGKTCVPIWANYLRRPELDKVVLYAQKLAAIDRSIEINAENMRYTSIVSVPENKRLTYQNLIAQHQSGAPVIFGTEELQPGIEENVNVFDVGVDPRAIGQLWDAKNQLWNECMTMLGINNANQDKRERLVAAEVSANDEQVQGTKNIALNARQYACEQINKLFGLDVWVDFRKEPLPELEDEEGGEGEDDKPKAELKEVA